MPLVVPQLLAPLLAHPVAIFGGGVSGRAVAGLLAKVGAAGVIYDRQGGSGVVNNFGPAAGRAHRLVVFSPGFPPEHPWLAAARAAGLTCMGELDFAARFWRGRLVAITGTNGKTTLTEFLTHALHGLGREAFATGNIGYPLSRLAAETDGGRPEMYAVCEVSSFQAEVLEQLRADATLWTNFAEDHLERHPSLEAYFAAKWRLVEHTAAGAVFAGTSVQAYARRFGRTLAPAAAVGSEGKSPDARLAGTAFAVYPQRENFELAAAWWRAAGLREDDLLAAARRFRLGRHRLARVAVINGVTYWNDSKATNFHAVEAALGRFGAPVWLIAGGRAKGGDLAAFVRRIAPRVKHALLLGETAPALATQCAACAVPCTRCETLDAAVQTAAAGAVPGDHVLLSPAFASFDMFRGYDQRGDVFEQLVNNLGTSVVPR